MEPLSMEKVARKNASGQGGTIGSYRGRFSLATCLVPLVLGLAGCVDTEAFLLPSLDKPTGIPCEAAVAWNPEVLFRPDPVHRGNPSPGLGGRMYLFREGSDCPLVGDGSVVVDLYDRTHPGEGNNPIPLEEWRIDRETLKRLLRRDAVGWGYSLYLPWATYKPDIKEVELRLCYMPAKGSPLYAESSPLVFHMKDNLALPPVVSQSAKNANPAAPAGVRQASRVGG